MGLYLAVFDDDVELDGVEVGSYADFGAFRDSVVSKLEGGNSGSRFPTLILHSDCDGQWSSQEAAALERELTEIRDQFQKLPPIPISGDWQKQAAKTFGVPLRSLYDCYFDVDGEPLLDRLIGLAKLSQARKLPILFQ